MHIYSSLSLLLQPTTSTLFPYTTLFRSNLGLLAILLVGKMLPKLAFIYPLAHRADRRHGTFITLLMSTGLTFGRSEEHTSELQSRFDLVCRLLLEKKKYIKSNTST